MLCLDLCIVHVFVQPGGLALAVLVDDVVGQPTDWPVYANPLADRAPVELRVAAIDEPGNPRAAVPPAVAYPGALEHDPQAVGNSRAGGCTQQRCYLLGELRKNPFIRVNEVDPVVPELRETKEVKS